MDVVEAAAAVAAESSTGTWTEVWSNQFMDLDFYKAKVYRIEDHIVEGLLALYSPGLRNNFDVTVYLNPREHLRYQWKIKRDTAKRNYTREQVLASLERREPISAAYVRPQRNHADIVVRFHPPVEAEDETGAHLNARLTLRSTLAHPDLTDVIEASNGDRPAVTLEIGRERGRLVEFVEIDGQIDDDIAARLEQLIWDHVRDDLPLVGELHSNAIGRYQDGTVDRYSHPLALTQLLIAYHLIAAKARIVREHAQT